MAKPTTIKEALKKFEDTKKVVATEVDKVAIIVSRPIWPIILVFKKE